MKRKYFGTDGVRGRVGKAPITPDFVLALGYAAGKVLAEHFHASAHERPAVLVGKDTRVSGYMLEACLEAGLSAAGVDVCLTGPLPTPAIAYLTRALRLQAGIVISASHNPYFDNGIKFFSATGHKLPDEVELEIEARLDSLRGGVPCVESAHLGKARRINDAAGRYVEFCKSTFPADTNLRGLKLVVDCAHGAAYHVAPAVLHELGADVIAIGAAPDGMNINEGVGATHPEQLVAAVLAHQADLGIALDGDGDRVVMVDSAGQIRDGDQILYALVRSRLRKGPVAGVAGTLMSNLALEHALAAEGIPFVRTKVGDRYVMEALHARGWLYGGENSGHVLCLDRHTTGDGLISALQVLAALREADGDFGQLWGGLELYPQRLINVPMPRGAVWEQDPAVLTACASVEAALDGKGRVLLRASGTEPVLRVMVEGQDRGRVDTLAAELAADVEELLRRDVRTVQSDAPGKRVAAV